MARYPILIAATLALWLIGLALISLGMGASEFTVKSPAPVNVGTMLHIISFGCFYLLVRKP